MSNIGIHLEYINQKNSFSDMSGKECTVFIRDFLKEGNINHKYLRCTDIWDNKFEVLCAAISLDKEELFGKDIFRSKHLGKDAGYITY